MKALFIAIALLASVVSNGQYLPLGAITMWTDGYAITQQNDTLRGKIRVSSLTNDSPTMVIIRLTDDSKIKLKGEDLRLIAQQIPAFAYATGSIPRSREQIIFERVSNPRQKDKPMLLERLTPPGGAIALYFDASGWKKKTEFTFGNFTLETNPRELSYIAVKNGSEIFLARRGEINTVHERLFGDCPLFIRNYPVATRRDWRHFGELIEAYNQLCQQL